MPFRQAWFAMLNGAHIKLPSWDGYWAWENNTVMMHLKDGTSADIRSTTNVAYTFTNIASNEWEVIEDNNSKPDHTIIV